MKKFDIQGIDIKAPKSVVFAFIANPCNLPKWTQAFISASSGKAVMQMSQGQVEINLEVLSTFEQGTIDWQMTFPDSSVATAFSRVVEADKNYCIYDFVLMPPPVPPEEIEAALAAQSKVIKKELKTLKQILEKNG
jgi:hypothetical protein